MAEVVVFDIDAASAIQKLVQLRESTLLLKEEQKRLEAEVKKNNATSAEAAKSYEANAVILKNLQTEQRNLSRQVEGYAEVQKKATDTVNFANNSIQQNRELLKQLTAQYINLKNPPKEATEQIKRLSDTLKTQEAAIGDTRRNVGNYQDALSGLANRLPIVGKATDSLNRIQSASPVGRLVEIFFTLVDALKGNAEVMDTITFLTAAINKAFGLLADKAVSLGKGIVEAFTNPKKLIEDLAFVLTNPLEAFKKLSNAALQTGKDLLQAGKDGFDAAKLQDEFTISIAKTNAAIEENDIQVQALTKSLKDRTKSEKERIAIANQIADLEIKNSQLAKQLAQDELNAEELKLKGKKLAAEEEAKLIELRSKVTQAAAEQDIAIAQRTTRINILLEKEQTANLKKELKERNEAVIDYQKIATENQKKFIDEFLNGVEKELELLDLQQEGRREFLEQSGLTEAEITEKFREERLEVIDEFNQKETDAQFTKLQEQLQAERDAAAERIELLQQVTEAEQAIQDARLAAAQGVIGIAKQIATNNNELQTILLVAEKAAAIAEVIINTQRANAAITANAVSVAPINPLGFPNPAFFAAQGTAAALRIRNNVQAGISIATIAAQTIASQLPKKAEGGEIEIGGKSHSQGGEIVTVGGKPVAEVEGGEGLFVMKKNAYQAIKHYSNINKAFGGKSWNTTSSFLQDGGAINTTLPRQTARIRVNEQIQQNREIVRALSAMPAPELSIVELNKKTAKRNKSVRVSEL